MKALIAYAVSISVALSGAVAVTKVLTDGFQGTKEEISVTLREAGKEAKEFGNQASHDLLMQLNAKYGKQYIKRQTTIISTLGDFVTGLDPVLHEGVDKLTTDFHATLDKLDKLLDSVRSLSFLDKSRHKLTSQVDEIIEQGKKAARERSIDLYSKILNAMGEYFKGFAPHDTYQGRSVGSQTGSEVPEGATEGMLAVVHNTFAIVDNETEKILGEIDHIGGGIKHKVEEAWIVLKRVRPHTEVGHMKLLLQSIFENQFRSTAEQKTGSAEDGSKHGKSKQ